jgi:hypothetical protein
LPTYLHFLAVPVSLTPVRQSKVTSAKGLPHWRGVMSLRQRHYTVVAPQLTDAGAA